ncbi:MAG: hypothetical protein ACT6RZ_08390 [Methylophilus sp.]|uniref:hypothetical protein n=1 Tax=Methylophilus sp. TaxID=29541 RepID=UPI004035FA8C
MRWLYFYSAMDMESLVRANRIPVWLPVFLLQQQQKKRLLLPRQQQNVEADTGYFSLNSWSWAGNLIKYQAHT